MTMTEFKVLEPVEQDELVMDYGTHLINYYEGDTMCDVYKMYAFFVKFCYNINKQEKPSITALTGTDDFHLCEHQFFAFSGN